MIMILCFYLIIFSSIRISNIHTNAEHELFTKPILEIKQGLRGASKFRSNVKMHNQLNTNLLRINVLYVGFFMVLDSFK